ncbi:MAG: hypothetical protein ABGZ17_31145 [Planctomycetaceae bacterium]
MCLSQCRSTTTPVPPEVTLEVFAFREAAEQSKRQGGKSILLGSILKSARTAALKKLAAP